MFCFKKQANLQSVYNDMTMSKFDKLINNTLNEQHDETLNCFSIIYHLLLQFNNEWALAKYELKRPLYSPIYVVTCYNTRINL